MFCDTKINEIAGDIFSDHRELEKIELRQGIIKCNNLDLSSLDKLKEIKIWNLIQLDFVKPALEKINFDDTRKVKLIFKRPLKEEKVVILASKEDVKKLSSESFYNYFSQDKKEEKPVSSESEVQEINEQTKAIKMNTEQIKVFNDNSLPLIDGSINAIRLVSEVHEIRKDAFRKASSLKEIYVQNIVQANKIIDIYSSSDVIKNSIVKIYFPSGKNTVVVGQVRNIKLESEDDCVDILENHTFFTETNSGKIVKGYFGPRYECMCYKKNYIFDVDVSQRDNFNCDIVVIIDIEKKLVKKMKLISTYVCLRELAGDLSYDRNSISVGDDVKVLEFDLPSNKISIDLFDSRVLNNCYNIVLDSVDQIDGIKKFLMQAQQTFFSNYGRDCDSLYVNKNQGKLIKEGEYYGFGHIEFDTKTLALRTYPIFNIIVDSESQKKYFLIDSVSDINNIAKDNFGIEIENWFFNTDSGSLLKYAFNMDHDYTYFIFPSSLGENKVKKISKGIFSMFPKVPSCSDIKIPDAEFSIFSASEFCYSKLKSENDFLESLSIPASKIVGTFLVRGSLPGEFVKYNKKLCMKTKNRLCIFLEISEGIEEIDKDAFCYSCNYVYSIHIPTTIKVLHPDTLQYLFNLQEVYIKDSAQLKMLIPALKKLFEILKECKYNLNRVDYKIRIIVESKEKVIASNFIKERLSATENKEIKQIVYEISPDNIDKFEESISKGSNDRDR